MARKKIANEPPTDEGGAMEQRVIAFAEQLGRMVGTVERKTTGWLDMATLSDQLTRIRDGAADLLGHLGRGAGAGEGDPTGGSDPAAGSQVPAASSYTAGSTERVSKAGVRKTRSPRTVKPPSASTSGLSREHVAAPGKTRRKPPVSVAGVTHSNEEIAKAGASDRNRRTRGR
jgi:hypothetical protein